MDIETIRSIGTQECQLESAHRFGVQLNVLDTPGLLDTGKFRRVILNKLLDVMSFCPEGVNAFLLVLNCTTRFTNEEFQAFNTLKNFFGPDFLRVCFLVFTYGEVYDQKMRIPFDQWLRQQTNNNQLNFLLRECEYRFFLFYNERNYKQKSENAVYDLLSLICITNKQYSHSNFAKAAQVRQKMAVEDDLPQLQSHFQSQLSLISAAVEDAQRIPPENLNHECINRIQREVYNLLFSITKEDKNTGLLNDFKEKAKMLMTMGDDLQSNKERAEEKLKKIREYAQLLKNPPKKRGMVLARLGLIASIASGVGFLVGSIVFPPLVPCLLTSALGIAGNVKYLENGFKKTLEYEKRKEELENELKHM
ncbi:Immune-associated nucleotide-binding protein 10 [Bulinus truncatus]|nr:Immune-associated nucleotide-binding protein 10 [Bulinus truncatus]